MLIIKRNFFFLFVLIYACMACEPIPEVRLRVCEPPLFLDILNYEKYQAFYKKYPCRCQEKLITYKDTRTVIMKVTDIASGQLYYRDSAIYQGMFTEKHTFIDYPTLRTDSIYQQSYGDDYEHTFSLKKKFSPNENTWQLTSYNYMEFDSIKQYWYSEKQIFEGGTLVDSVYSIENEAKENIYTIKVAYKEKDEFSRQIDYDPNHSYNTKLVEQDSFLRLLTTNFLADTVTKYIVSKIITERFNYKDEEKDLKRAICHTIVRAESGNLYFDFIGYGRVPPDYEWHPQLFQDLYQPFLEETKIHFDTCKQSFRAEWKFELDEDKLPYEKFYVLDEDNYVERLFDRKKRKHYKNVEFRLHKVPRRWY